MKNYTIEFFSITNDVLIKNREYFKAFENAKKIENNQYLQETFFDNYDISRINDKNSYCEHIKQFILSYKNDFSMNTSVLYKISKQIKIDYLLSGIKKSELNLYYTLSETLNYYGIFREDKIVSFSNKKFWEQLIKKCYLLNIYNGFRVDFKEDYMIEIQYFSNALKYFKNKMNLNLDCIDGNIVFKKHDVRKIVCLIEKKLQQIDLFKFIDFILIQDRNNKNIPFNYIINLSIKNIHYSNFKKKDEKTFKSIIELFINFLNLYELRSFNMWEYTNIDETNIEEKLRKQILHSNLYILSYPLKNLTVINYINTLLGEKILNNDFNIMFGFAKNNLILFLQKVEELSQKSNIIKIDTTVYYEFKNIIEFFAIESNNINLNYSNPINSSKSENIFVHNPIIKYKEIYYLIGYKYFKMNFYNALINKIRLVIDSKINYKIGNNIDIYVENLFQKNNFDIYSGEYKISKKEKYECDLVIKLDNKIIFIENKNKGLSKNSHSGSSIHILQDFIRAFATSQFQLLRHEKNILDKKHLQFTNGKILKYDNEQIIKISLSPNNWYSVMNNIPRNMLYALSKLRFGFKDNILNEIKEDFEETNKDLKKLTDILIYLEQKHNLDHSLFNSLFIPLELISENESDIDFIHCILGLLNVKYNTNNIYDSYLEYKKLKNYEKKFIIE